MSEFKFLKDRKALEKKVGEIISEFEKKYSDFTVESIMINRSNAIGFHDKSKFESVSITITV